MPLVLVSDTSVLIDLNRGDLLPAVFELPYEFAVPDLLYERELTRWDGPTLEGRLVVLTLDGAGVTMAVEYRRREPRLSLPDAFALTLAKAGGHILLAGDKSLRELATEESVECHGVLWMLDLIEQSGALESQQLHTSLTRISEHPRCRLPRNEVRDRLERYRDQEGTG